MICKPRRRLGRKLFNALLWLLCGWVVLSILAVTVLRFVPPPISAVMLERWLAAQVRAEKAFHLHYRWTGWDRLSKQLPLAVIAAEDQKFPFHHGFDVASIRDALADADAGERLRGASTISQQVAKNLFLWNGRSFVRKGLEAWYTVLLETLWPKRRIVEVYCNIAEFGDGIYGAGAAGERFFHEPADRIDAHQAALMAAVLPNPQRLHIDRPSAYVLRRAHWIERQTEQLGGVSYVP
ncbi:MAG: monofunctional biosynthetic peptidoglycan transglycosylase [Rhodanobacteraceae bacterium]